MNLVAIMPVRNEDWILGLSARVALLWCDRIIILNHASTDGTARIINELGAEYKERIISVGHGRTEWDEMSDRQWLLGFARANGGETGATHIALIDADEILTGNLISGIRERVAALSLGQMLTLPLYNLRGGLNRYHLNGVWGQRTVSVAFKDVNTASWKGDTFHKREPDGVQWQRINFVLQGMGGIVHFWGANEQRLHEKHRLYRVSERVRWPHKDVSLIEMEYSQAERGRPWMQDTPERWTFADTPHGWLSPYADLMQYLKLDCEPWHRAEADRLIAEHGKLFFAGLSV